MSDDYTIDDIKRLDPPHYRDGQESEPIPDSQPAWRDRPTVPGWYICHRKPTPGVWCQLEYLAHANVADERFDRVYVPIPPDTKGER